MGNDLTFGQWLKRRRRGLGLTQRSLGHHAGYASETIRKVEADLLRPSRQMAERLAVALQLEPAEQARFVQFARDEPDADDHTLSTQTVPVQSTTDTRRHNLPAPLTTFIGREEELGAVTELVGTQRLVTLTGPGGVGKTRLALRVAKETLGQFPAGVWLVELADVADAALVAQEVAGGLGLRDTPGRPALESLTRFLRDRELLLVLDNCEHLLEACAPLVHTLLRACPGLALLATSREPLGVEGEAVFQMPSLAWPAWDQSASLEHVTAFASVRLFTDRARLVRPEYQLAARDAAAVANICRRVDGIPLAIEMAAARVNTLSIEQLAGRLDDAFRVLISGSRTAVPRQQTLRATIDWSYDLLAEGERLLLQRLSVFAGGCSLEAAEAVCAAEGLQAGQVLEVVAMLIAKSMLIADRLPGEPTRYHLLETVRQYAGEKLEAAGESSRLRTRHRDYFIRFVEANLPLPGSQDRHRQIRKLQGELENLRRALDWSFRNDEESDHGPRLISMLYDYWPFQQEWLEWNKRAIAWCQSHPGTSPVIYMEMLQLGSTFASLNDPYTAVAWSEQAVAICRLLGPSGAQLLVRHLRHLGWLQIDNMRNPAQARAAYGEGETLLKMLGPEQFPPQEYLFYQAWFAAGNAFVAVVEGKYSDAKRLATESVRIFEATGHGYIFTRADALIYLGAACLHLAEFDEARGHFREAIRVAETLGGHHGANRKAYGLRWLGLAELWRGNLRPALDYCCESIRLANETPDYNIIASCLGLCAGVAAKQGRAERAAQLAGAAQAMYLRQHRKPWEDSSLDTLLPGWREGPDKGLLLVAYEAGQAMPADQAVEYALSE
jgi:predicted ATPase/transcriptional regulator with XRE-family HTH domain